MPLTIDTLVLGPLDTNCYVVRDDGGDCWVFDPGMGEQALLRFLQQAAASPSRIMLTHGHGDHIAGAGALKQAFPDARLCCGEGDLRMLSDAGANMSAMFGVTIVAPPADEIVRPGQVLRLGQFEWQVLDTSGHTSGSVSYYCSAAGVVVTGDALFEGTVGRVDIPGGSAGRLLKNIRLNLLSLPDGTQVLPGHGRPTTIGQERRSNPFLKESYKLRST